MQCGDMVMMWGKGMLLIRGTNLYWDYPKQVFELSRLHCERDFDTLKLCEGSRTEMIILCQDESNRRRYTEMMIDILY